MPHLEKKETSQSDKWLLDKVGRMGRALLGDQLDKLLGAIPKSLGYDSIFSKDKSEKPTEKDLPKLLADLNENLEKLNETLSKQSGVGGGEAPSTPFGALAHLYKTLKDFETERPVTEGARGAKDKTTRAPGETEEVKEEKEGGGLMDMLNRVMEGRLKKFMESLLKGTGEVKGPPVAEGAAPAAGEAVSAEAATAATGAGVVEAAAPAVEGAAVAEGAAAVGAGAGEGIAATAAAGAAAAPATGGLSLLITALATAAAGTVLLVEAVAKAVNGLRSFTDEMLRTNLQFADFSASMAAVQVQLELQAITLSQMQGKMRAEPTANLASARFETEKNIAPLSSAWANIKSDFGTAMNDAVNKSGLGTLISSIGNGLDEIRKAARIIAFWTDWDKKNRSTFESGANPGQKLDDVAQHLINLGTLVGRFRR